jgi:hypothetical protein
MDEQLRLQIEVLADHAIAQMDHAAERQRAQARYEDPDDTERTRPPLGVEQMTAFATDAARDCIETAALAGCDPKPSKASPPQGLPENLHGAWAKVKAISAAVAH